MTTHNWQTGQKAVIDRREVVTIDRVTLKGHAVVGVRHFRSDGRQISGDKTLAPWTPEAQARVDLNLRGDHAKRAMYSAIVRANARWGGWFGSSHRPRDATADEIAKAEELTAAINRILRDQT